MSCGPSTDQGIPVPSGRGRLRRSGSSRAGSDRPTGHGKGDAGLDHERIIFRVLHPGLFPQNGTCHLGERCTARDSCDPLGSDEVWTSFQCHRLWQPDEPACRVHQQEPGLFANPEDRHRRAPDLRSWLEAALGRSSILADSFPNCSIGSRYSLDVRSVAARLSGRSVRVVAPDRLPGGVPILTLFPYEADTSWGVQQRG